MYPVILTHGGANSANEKSDGCERACREAAIALTDGDKDAALRAAIEAAVVLEDDPRFNAGTGANMRIDGSLEQDAICAASDGRIGAVACLESTKNPIRVARLVMDSPHVMLCGGGATRFARERGIPAHDCATEASRRKLNEALDRLRTGALKPHEQKWRGGEMTGTIGAVTRAADGSFAVACSTGGTSLMLPGRIGDSPIFGAGVMVGDAGAVCATGDGEEVIRRLCSMRVYIRLAEGMDAQEAVETEVKNFPESYWLGLIAVGRESYGIAVTQDRMARYALELKD